MGRVPLFASSVEPVPVSVAAGDSLVAVTVIDFVRANVAPAAFVPNKTMVWLPEAADGTVTATDTAPLALAVPTPSVVGAEYMPAVTAEPGLKPVPESVTAPPAVVAPATVRAPFEVGRFGGNSGALTKSILMVPLGTQVVSTFEPEATSLKITLLIVTVVGAPVAVPVMVAPGTAERAGIAP